MTLRAHYDTPCWQLNDPDTGQPPEYESDCGWAHYRTAEEATGDLVMRQAEWLAGITLGRLEPPLKLVVAQSYAKPCLGLFCNGEDEAGEEHGEAMDMSGEGHTHLDPDDPTPVDLADMEITTVGELHYCPDCAPPIGDDE